jgi:hypothetical protein
MAAPLSRAVLRERTAEIFAYLRFLNQSVQTGAAIVCAGKSPPMPLSKDLTHTLKANTYLLLYNIVEATMTQAIADIHNALDANLPELDHLQPALFSHVLRRFRASTFELGSVSAAHGGQLMVRLWLDDYANQIKTGGNNPLFSGNVDSRKIIEIGAKYGFASEADKHLRERSLQTTKLKRNELAHGSTSFRDCGQGLSTATLTSEAVALIRCLRRVVSAVEDYLIARRYLRPQLPGAVPAPLQPQV